MEEEKSKGKVISPEQLDTYLQVAGGAPFFMFLAVLLITAGFLLWGIFGKVKVTLPVSLVYLDDWIVAYVNHEDKGKIEKGMKVETSEQDGSVVNVADTPEHLNGSIVYPVFLSFPQADDLTATTGAIVLKDIAPLSYVTSS